MLRLPPLPATLACFRLCSGAFCVAAVVVVSASAGCSSFWNRSRSDSENAELQKLLEVPTPPETIGLATRPLGLEPMTVTGVSAVNGLPSTGGSPDPSPSREELLEEMKRHNVPDGEQFLEGDDSALVRVQAFIPPGARRGDAVDVQVICPPDARATDLAGGWLLDTRLHEQMRVRSSAFSGPSIRKGATMVIATGFVLTHAGYDSSSRPEDRLEGLVIRGGRIQKDRALSLAIARKYSHAKVASAVADAINDRYFFFDGSSKHGIANAANETTIQIEVPPRYRHSVPRLMASVAAIVINPQRRQSQAYLQEISDRLKSPSSAAGAALAAEALGEAAVPTLLAELQNSNQEIRFYVAEALAYLDRPEAIAPLQSLVAEVPAFRYPGFVALAGMKHARVNESLEELLNHESLETRYSAMTTLRKRKAVSSRIAGRKLGSFTLYEVAPPANGLVDGSVVGSLRGQPELVVTGKPEIQITSFLRAPSGVVAKAVGDDKIEIHRFVVDGEDRHAEVDRSAAGFIVGLAQVGCRYQQVIEMLRIAKDGGALSDQFVMDPLPKPLRTYHRED